MQKKLTIAIYIILTFTLLIMVMCSIIRGETDQVSMDGCYVCYMHDHYVVFRGQDTSEKRQRAEDVFGCRVYATLTYCNPNNFSQRVYIDVLSEK